MKAAGVFLFYKKEGIYMEEMYQREGDRLIVRMPQEVDHHVAGTMSREIDFLVDTWNVHTVVFDFSDTQFMDSSGIGVLIGRKKAMELHAGTVVARNLSGRAYKIFEKSGLERIIAVEKEEN